TLHTNNAIDVSNRLLDMGLESYLLGSTLSAVIAQRLVRKVCPHCRKKEKMPEEVYKDIQKELKDVPQNTIDRRVKKDFLKKGEFYKGEGCPRCGKTGYVDRVSITEVMEITEEIKKIIMENKKTLTTQDVLDTQEFVTMKQDGIIKVLNGLTTMEEVLRVVNR
ncbi:MAG: GspE/PulE family protein, partial [Patescibacteria group bacterium]